MTFQTIQTQLQSLETHLIQSNTYETVLALKGEITSLILSFNRIERINCSEAPETILAIKNNIRNLRENYLIKIQNLRPVCAPQVVNMDTLFKKDSMCEIAGIPSYQFFHSPTSYLQLNPDHELFSSELLRPQLEQEIVSRTTPIGFPLASELISESACHALLIRLKKLLKEETEGQVEGDYKDTPKRKSDKPEPYVCIMDDNIRSYYGWEPESEFSTYSRYLLSTVRPEYLLETEHFQQSIVTPEPKEDTEQNKEAATALRAEA